MFLSYLIKYKKMANLVSGYNEDDIADKNGLCNWISSTMIWPGIFAIIAGFLMWQYPVTEMWVTAAFAIITIAAAIIATVGGKKFRK
jgi:hypothetical protein